MSATLILNAGTASPITVVVQQAGETAPTEIGLVTPSFNGADRSSVRAIKRNFGALTAYLSTADKDAVINLLKNGRQLPCSGELLADIQTQCTMRYTGARMISGIEDPGLWEVGLTGNEVQPNNVLLRYSPGDTITGSSFTRSTVAHQTDAAGIYVSKAIDVKRDGHYIGGIVSTLLEDERVNSILQSRNLAVTWTASGTGAATQDAVGLDGTANSATTITDTDAAVSAYRVQSVTVPVDSNKHCISWWIDKDTDQTRFPMCYAKITGGTAVTRGVHLNTQTGASLSVFIAGVGTSRVIDGGLWWIVEITLTNNASAGNSSLETRFYPASCLAIDETNNNVLATGSCIVGHVQVELNSSFYSSPIFTTTVALARGADSYSLPFTTAPGEMTVYAKFVEGGNTVAGPGTVFQVSNAASANERFEVYASGGPYVAYHRNAGSGAISTALAAAPVIGDGVELAARLYGDASIDIVQSINSAAATSASQTAAYQFETAWSGPLVWLNSAGSGLEVGFTALRSFKIVAGARSLAEMREA